MLAKPLLLIILAACAAPSGAAVNSSHAEPDEPTEFRPPPEPPQETGQTFCCKEVDADKNSGEDCTPISHSDETIHACANVLSCGEEWTKKDGVVKCG
jgi:hypothetical protein